ncbi:MAG: PD40 domain-containing protein [Candidatus Pacebacteria bacterium]|nr:PD40 domain-containing protein [Candidatus Paceibacterota bacterium]
MTQMELKTFSFMISDTDTIERVSIDSEGLEGNNTSVSPSISADGSSVVFHSYASNLVAGDTNGIEDIFVRDLVNDITERVSIDDEGAEGNSDSYNPSISSDGNLIAFQSNATNLVADDTNGFEDIFVYDRENNTISRLTADDEGNQTNSNSYNPAISADGAYVLFGSNASNLVDGDTNDAQYDVFWVPLATEGVPYIITEVTPIPRTTTDRSPIYHFAIEGEGEAELFVGDGCGSSILATALGSEPDDQQIEFSDLEYGETYECIISVYSDAGYSNELVVGPFTVRRSTSSGSSASSTSFSRSTAPTANPTQTPSQAPKFTFTKNLKFLMNDIEVKELQKFLNTNGYPISTVGAGSVGFETTLFGAKTKAALIAFQKANNITPAVGYFGPITRGIINSMLK